MCAVGYDPSLTKIANTFGTLQYVWYATVNWGESSQDGPISQ